MFLFSSFFDALLIRKKATTIDFVFFQVPLTLSPVTGRRVDYTIFRVDIGVTDRRDLKQPSLCCHFNHMFHGVA